MELIQTLRTVVIYSGFMFSIIAVLYILRYWAECTVFAKYMWRHYHKRHLIQLGSGLKEAGKLLIVILGYMLRDGYVFLRVMTKHVISTSKNLYYIGKSKLNK